MEDDSSLRHPEAVCNKSILLHKLRAIDWHQGTAEQALIVLKRLLLIDPKLTFAYRGWCLLFKQLECFTPRSRIYNII